MRYVWMSHRNCEVEKPARSWTHLLRSIVSIKFRAVRQLFSFTMKLILCVRVLLSFFPSHHCIREQTNKLNWWKRNKTEQTTNNQQHDLIGKKIARLFHSQTSNLCTRLVWPTYNFYRRVQCMRSSIHLCGECFVFHHSHFISIRYFHLFYFEQHSFVCQTRQYAMHRPCETRLWRLSTDIKR